MLDRFLDIYDEFKILFIISEIAIAFLVFCLSFNLNNPTSSIKTGYLLKISNEGVFKKTNEVSIIQGGFVDGTGGNGNISQVTIPDSLIEKTQSYFVNHKEVLISYKCPLISLSLNSSSGCFADNIYTK